MTVAKVDASGNTLATLATTIAGEDIANDWLKVKQGAPPAGLKYGLAELFASDTVNATSWNYGVVLNCAGYSKMFGYAQVNTPNGSAYWCYFSVGITSNVSNRYNVHAVTNVADNAVSWFDNVDSNGMTAIGEWCQMSIYNPDAGAATITDAALYLLP